MNLGHYLKQNAFVNCWFSFVPGSYSFDFYLNITYSALVVIPGNILYMESMSKELCF